MKPTVYRHVLKFPKTPFHRIHFSKSQNSSNKFFLLKEELQDKASANTKPQQ